MPALVSCILATYNRPAFLRQAIRYYTRQTYPNKELIILDDSPNPTLPTPPSHPTIKYIWLDTPTSLGQKLNLGIDRARGNIIQKIDDDDYYHPPFLSSTVQALEGQNPLRAVVGFGSFLVLIAPTGALTTSGSNWMAGGTLCFHRALWQRGPFRDLPRAVDWWFLKDHAPHCIKIHKQEQYILVRHDDGHAWTRMGDTDVTHYFSHRPAYPKQLTTLLSAEDVAFYQSLHS